MWRGTRDLSEAGEVFNGVPKDVRRAGRGRSKVKGVAASGRQDERERVFSTGMPFGTLRGRLSSETDRGRFVRPSRRVEQLHPSSPPLRTRCTSLPTHAAAHTGERPCRSNRPAVSCRVLAGAAWHSPRRHVADGTTHAHRGAHSSLEQRRATRPHVLTPCSGPGKGCKAENAVAESRPPQLASGRRSGRSPRPAGHTAGPKSRLRPRPAASLRGAPVVVIAAVTPPGGERSVAACGSRPPGSQPSRGSGETFEKAPTSEEAGESRENAVSRRSSMGRGSDPRATGGDPQRYPRDGRAAGQLLSDALLPAGPGGVAKSRKPVRLRRSRTGRFCRLRRNQAEAGRTLPAGSAAPSGPRSAGLAD